MANPWFRMYSEFATDPKVQMLSESDQRRLTMLFCLRCNDHVTLHDTEVTFLLRISNDEWQVTKALFVERGFTNESNEILNWDKRQFTSDTSKNRVAAYRERKKQSSNVDVTLQKQKSNAIDTDTDTEHIKTNVTFIKSRFIDFWNSYPKTSRKVGKTPCEKKWKAKNLDSIAEKIINHVNAIKTSQQWKDGFEPSPLTYINQERWNDDFASSSEIPEWQKNMVIGD